MSLSHEFYICRAAYAATRERGVPAVNLVELGEGICAGETADGQLMIETLSGCCKWSMKFEVAQQWLKLYGKPEHSK